MRSIGEEDIYKVRDKDTKSEANLYQEEIICNDRDFKRYHKWVILPRKKIYKLCKATQPKLLDESS